MKLTFSFMMSVPCMVRGFLGSGSGPTAQQIRYIIVATATCGQNEQNSEQQYKSCNKGCQ